MDLRPMELKDTAEMMQSPDYKERFRAEYFQLKIRAGKLRSMCDKYEAKLLDFTPSCPLPLLREQLACMMDYLRCLEIRANMEKVDLTEPGLAAAHGQAQ